MASPSVTVNSFATPQSVTAASTVNVALASVAGVNSWTLTCLSTDETITAATVNASVVVNNTTKTATFTAPAAGTAMLFQSQVNGGLNSNGLPDATQTTTFAVFVPAANGNLVLALGMTFEPSATNGWLAIFNAVARASASGGSNIMTTVAIASTTATVAGTPGYVKLTGATGAATVTLGATNFEVTVWNSTAYAVTLTNGVNGTTGQFIIPAGGSITVLSDSTSGVVASDTVGAP